MAGKSGLITEDELFKQIKVPTESTTTDVAEYLKIGDKEYRISGDAHIFFQLQTVEGVPKTEYDLTDAQLAEFRDAKRTYLILRLYESESVYTDQLLTTQTRTLNFAKFVGGDRKMWSFTAQFESKKGIFRNLGDVMSDKEIITSLIVPSETELATKHATSIKFGDTYWALGPEGVEYVRKTGDTMSGPLVLTKGASSTQPAYITATENAGAVVLKSPLFESTGGMYISLADTRVELGGGFAEKLLVINADAPGVAQLTWNDSNVLTTENIVNNLTTTYAGCALDARQGKKLFDTKIGENGGTIKGPLVLDKNSEGDYGYITATEAAKSILLRYPSDLTKPGRQITIDSTGVYLTRTDGVGLAADFANQKLTWMTKTVIDTSYIKNDYITQDEGFVLDARMGMVLKGAIDTKISIPESDIGSRTKPVYIKAGGTIIACDWYAGGSAVNLNGVSRAADTAAFFAPTTAGAAGQYLSATNGEPAWKSIINDLASAATDQPLSAAMGKSLNDRIDSLSSLGRFLSIWDCSLGVPKDDPSVPLYTYKSGDYYVVGVVKSSGNNYRPSGTTYSKGTISTVVETESVKVGDYYRYSGTSWILEPMQQQEVSFKTLTGSVSDNDALVAEFAKYIPVSGGTMSGALYIGDGSHIQAKGDTFTLMSKSGANGSSINLTDSKVSIGKAGFLLTMESETGKLKYNNTDVLLTSDIVNDLTTGGTTKPLSAQQGVALNTAKLNKYGDSMMGVLSMGVSGTLSTFITSSVENTNGTALFSPNMAPTGEGMCIEVKDSGIYIGNINKEWSLLTLLNEGTSYYLQFKGKNILTTDDIANDLATTSEGKVLDARQGKALYDLKLSTTGGTMTGPIVLGSTDPLDACITATGRTSGVLLKSPLDAESNSGLHLLIKDNSATLARGNDMSNALIFTYDESATPVSSLSIHGAKILLADDVVNDLTTGGVDKPLSAEQGKELNANKLGLEGGRLTGTLTMLGGEDCIINTNSSEGLYLKSAAKSGAVPCAVISLLDGKATLGTLSASLAVQTTKEGVSTCTFNNKSILTAGDIVDDLTTGGSDKVLSAEQGKVLAQRVGRFYTLKASSPTVVDTANGNIIISTGGNLIAVYYDVDTSKFVVNGEEVASGSSITVGSVTLKVEFVTSTKYILTVSKTAIVTG